LPIPGRFYHAEGVQPLPFHHWRSIIVIHEINQGATAMARKPGRPRNENKKSRIQIAIEPETREVIERLAAAMDSSMAAVAGSILDDNREELRVTAEAMERVLKTPTQKAKAMHLMMLELQKRSTEEQLSFLQDISDEANKEE